VKDETRSPGGSHKARPLMSQLVHLEVAERLGLADAPVLAALGAGPSSYAAALLARCADRPLDVYLAAPASEAAARLAALGAKVVPCTDEPAARAAFLAALEAGALPFTVRGSENGLGTEGAMTVAYELVTDMLRAGAAPDRVLVPLGAGTLAAATAQALREAVAFGLLPHLPRLHAVETPGSFPLHRAWERLAQHLLPQLAPDPSAAPGDDDATADALRRHASEAPVRLALRYAATHRSEFVDADCALGPTGDAAPTCDDDWLGAVRGLVESGGTPLQARRPALDDAASLARMAGVEPHAAGAAALAGLVTLADGGGVGPEEHVVVVLSGTGRPAA
jgi:threonine synthase